MDGKSPELEREPVSTGGIAPEADDTGTSSPATTQGQGQDSRLKKEAANEPSQLAPAITTTSPHQQPEGTHQEQAL